MTNDGSARGSSRPGTRERRSSAAGSARPSRCRASAASRRQRQRAAQRGLDVADASVGIAVDRDPREPLAELARAARRAARYGFSIASSLISPARRLDRVARACDCDVLAHRAAMRSACGASASCVVHPCASSRRAGAARACAARPSPCASVAGDRPERLRAPARADLDHARALLEIVDAERRREARACRPVGSTWFGPAQ